MEPSQHRTVRNVHALDHAVAEGKAGSLLDVDGRRRDGEEAGTAAAIDEALGSSVEAPAASVGQLGRRLSATIMWLPVAVAVAIVFGHLTLHFVLQPMTTTLGVVAFGAAVGVAVWLLGSLVTTDSVRPDRANPASYEALVMRLAVVEDDIRQQLQGGALSVRAAPVVQLRALKARLEASPPKPDWSSGNGYVIAWRDLHRIEEELIATTAEDRLESILARDRGRVDGSKLARKDSAVSKLLDEAEQLRKSGTLGAHRALLRDIREAVDEFRDTRFAALVEHRSHLERVSMVLGFIAVAILGIGVLRNASTDAVVAVSILYLVGAAAGLFTQLSGTDATTSSENIFGYGQAEVRLTILASGLAAVGGAFLTWFVSATAGDTVPKELAGAFALTPISVLTAAFFGLAPGTLLDRVNSWAKANIADLESTSGSDSKQG